MNTASGSSKPRARLVTILLDKRAGPAAERRRDRRELYRLFAPPDVRHRRREARRWLLELAVRTTNPLVSERRPGQRLFDTCAERRAVGDALYEKLGSDDPELLGAVERLRFEDYARDMGITLDQRKRRWQFRWERISQVRAEMQRAGLV